MYSRTLFSLFLMMSAFALSWTQTSSAGVDHSGGGDAYVQNFVDGGYEVYAWLTHFGSNLSPPVSAQAFLDNLQKAVKSGEIQSTNDPLQWQDVAKDAIYKEAQNTTYLVRPRWNPNTLDSSKLQIVAHEIFRRMGLNDDLYEISHQIVLNATNASPVLLDQPTHDSNPPIPAGSFSYTEGEKDFNAGKSPTSQQLQGTWITVAGANIANWPVEGDPQYDPSGLKNSDGSSLMKLQFSEGKAFDGAIQTNVLLYNFGQAGVNLGPNAIDLNFSAVSFGIWGWDTTYSRLQKAVHFDLSCRVINSQKMICASTFHIDEKSGVTSDYWDFDGKVTTYLGYVRK